MLQVKSLKAGYDNVPVVFGVDFEVGQGEIVAIVGSNGAGKTTIVRAVSGLIRPMEGTVEFVGRPVQGMRAHEITSLGVAHVPEGRRVFAKMSVEDNLLLGAHTVREQSAVAQTLQEVYEVFPVLHSRRDQKAETLSGGEQQMLAVGRGLMPTMVDRVLQVLREIRDRGVTVLMVEQKVEKALAMADRAYVLQTGRIAMSGIGRELLENPEIKRAYLGL
ncbi:MAG TPA: ABC transporter ATP-binding protein [Bacillota bacterium]|jgi:branched-chain amino acid transport system ATP-binding protein|nr:ABC transporter ATP-binding protein [Bacillota bacterium]